MLDMKKVGIKICAFRKKIGYSQEKLAEILRISPQAVSKWENGRTLPDTQTLPVLAQIFGCTIDDIIMPAYAFDEEIEIEKPTKDLEQQAEHIAKIVVKQIGNNIVKNTNIGLDDCEIINAVKRIHPNMSKFEIIKSTPEKNGRYILIYITVKTPQAELKLAEKVYRNDDNELRRYSLLNKHIPAAPAIYFIDAERKILLMEDLSEKYIQGYDFNEDNEYGKIIRKNYNAILNAAAKFHGAFWDNYGAFEKVGLDWRLGSKENLFAHISGMAKDFRKYRKNEEAGKIAKEGIGVNNITKTQLDYFEQALEYLKTDYVALIDSRFNAGKNITVIHGDLHPGNTFMSKSADRTVKFIGMQSVRMGLCTEDLAMLIALHISADKTGETYNFDNKSIKEVTKNDIIPLLKYYYECLCETVKDYPYETFINDYKISIAENMFYTIRLINGGINDFCMRDRAIRAFETFVLEKE